MPALAFVAALLALDRADEALALCDADDADALDVRARALRMLGRDAEAEQTQRLVTLAGARSEGRLRIVSHHADANIDG